MTTWGYEFHLLVLIVSLTALEDKIGIPAQPCNILYLFQRFFLYYFSTHFVLDQFDLIICSNYYKNKMEWDDMLAWISANPKKISEPNQ